jgi:hypothetical protein
MMINFEALIGKTVPIMIPIMNPNGLVDAIIRGVEAGGIWIECENLTQSVLVALGVSALKTPVFFVPFQQIKFASYGSETLALSDKAFGV